MESITETGGGCGEEEADDTELGIFYEVAREESHGCRVGTRGSGLAGAESEVEEKGWVVYSKLVDVGFSGYIME